MAKIRLYRDSSVWRAAMPIKLLGPNTEHLTNATAVWTHFTIVDAPGAYDVFEPGRPHLQLRLERRTYIEPDRPLHKYSIDSSDGRLLSSHSKPLFARIIGTDRHVCSTIVWLVPLVGCEHSLDTNHLICDGR